MISSIAEKLRKLPKWLWSCSFFNWISRPVQSRTGGVMVFPHLLVAVVILFLAVIVSFGLYLSVRAYTRYRGKRIITCPETRQPAAVHVNALKAAKEAIFSKPNIRLDQCSRWPEPPNAARSAWPKLRPTLSSAWSGIWWMNGTRGSLAPIARSHSERFTGTNGTRRYWARIDQSCNGTRCLRKTCH